MATDETTDGSTVTGALKELFSADVGEESELSHEEAKEVFTSILTGEAPPAAIGALLVGIQRKPATTAELAGFLDAMRDTSVETADPIFDPADCTPPYTGVERTALLGVGADIVAAAVGAPVVLHDDAGVRGPDRYGNVDVLEELDANISVSTGESSSMTDEVRFGYYNYSEFNPKLDSLSEIRTQIGVPTPIDRIERFANPSDTDVYLGSYSDAETPEAVTDLLSHSETSNFSTVILYEAIEGYDVFDPSSPELYVWEDGEADYVDLDPDVFTYSESDLRVDDPVTDSARIIEEVLATERTDVYADAVLANAAIRMYALDRAETIQDGVERARQALSEGEAEETLGAIRTFRSTGTQSLDW